MDLGAKEVKLGSGARRAELGVMQRARGVVNFTWPLKVKINTNSSSIKSFTPKFKIEGPSHISKLGD